MHCLWHNCMLWRSFHAMCGLHESHVLLQEVQMLISFLRVSVMLHIRTTCDRADNQV